MKVSFTAVGFNPLTEKVQFIATVTGAKGTARFDYSGGILAFIPATRGSASGDGKEVRFDMWKTLEKMFERDYRTTNVSNVIKGIRNHTIKAKDNQGSPTVMAVFNAIANMARPKAEDCIACILMDAQATDYTFPDWCAEYGYSDDSREAERIFNLCKENGYKLQKILSPAEMEEAKKMQENF